MVAGIKHKVKDLGQDPEGAFAVSCRNSVEARTELCCEGTNNSEQPESDPHYPSVQTITIKPR